MEYDVIVTGAGPAGSIAAYICAQAGLQVLLLDKAKFPREKLCAGGLSIRSEKVLNLVGINLPSNIIERTISGAHFMGPDWKPFVIRTPQPFAYIVRRSQFDHFLALQAKAAGVQFLDGHLVTNIEQQKDRVYCHTSDETFEGRILIGADGASSIVGRLSGLRQPLKPDEFGIGLEVDVPVPSTVFDRVLDPAVIILWFIHIPLGYFWVFPRKESLSLGIAGVASESRKLFPLLRGFSQRFAQRVGAPLLLQKISGHMLPALAFRTPLVSGRVLLIGDAAGFIDAFTGQGICYALESGFLSAQTIITAIKHNHSIPQALNRYAQLAQQRFGEELRYSWSATYLLHAHIHGGLCLIRRLKSSSKFISDFARGDVDYYGIFRNPLSFLSKYLIHEIRCRLTGRL